MNLQSLLNETEKAKKKQEANSNANIINFANDVRTTIRLVPFNEFKELQFKPVWFYYKQSGLVSKTMFSPLTFGEEDPIVQYINETLAEGQLNTQEFVQLVKLAPRLMYITTAVIRGKEAEGTKFWIFSGGNRYDAIPFNDEGQYGALLKDIKTLVSEDATGSLTDFKSGYDIHVDTISKEKSSTGYKKVDFSIARKPSVLTTDKAIFNKITKEQPNWSEQYEVATADFLMKALSKYVKGGGDAVDYSVEDDDDNVVDVTSSSEEDDVLKLAEKEFNSKVPLSTVDVSTEDDLNFMDEESSDDTPVLTVDDDDDDLPF